MTKLLTFSFICATCLMIASCSKNETENYSLLPANEYHHYLLVKQGQLQYYRLDSTVTAPFGSRLILHSYSAKDSIGEPSIEGKDTIYPVYRYLNDTLRKGAWSYLYTYRWVLKANTVERIDDKNRRFIVLANPVKDGATWEGNRYFTSDLDQNDPFYGWEYTCILGTNQVRIDQKDIVNGNNGVFDPDGNPGSFQQQIKAFEVYDNQGLLEKELSFITYQPNSNTPGAFGFYDTDSYGVHLTREQP